ncbi:hypothetical protein [Gulosibacter chungangensis]|uniref:Uncharacterized protein n=1 Tax=Gulosibacter chungangensis TaxID=979746 RepID=A0A7J5B7C4_9MICO|nr:hypothetical protein [Gulosibacter chungangensis]KAB1640818.1 hypothetical protein F8O05_14040 [Gulosibacter chungangensis]
MRQLVVGVALALSLVSVLGTSGCASAEPRTEAQVDEFANYVGKLQNLTGVAAVDLNTNEQTLAASLTVAVDPDVAAESLTEIGAAVADFSGKAQERGFVPYEPVIQSGASSYSYFDELPDETIAEQLNYWLELQQASVVAVQLRTFTSTMNVPALGGPDGAADLGAEEAEQPPRYVLIDLPTDIPEADLRILIETLAAVPDPGATEGQWDFLNLAPRTKGEYAGPNFPSIADLSYAVTAGSHFAEVDGLANVEVLRDSGHDTPLRIRIAVFDDVMDGVGNDDAEATFEQTEAWTHLLDLVSLLEGAGALDYGVQVLANPLNDGGNFQLKFSVHGCELEADSRWPVLSNHLTAVWEKNASAERFEADPSCVNPNGGDHSHDEDSAGSDAD